MKKEFLFRLLLGLFVLTPLSCKKEDPATTPVVTPIVTAKGFQLSQTTVAPLGLLTVTLDEPSEAKTLEARLATTTVFWQQVDSKTYVFQIPESIAPGSYDLSIVNSSKKVSITISAPTVIADPTDYVQTFMKQTNEAFTRLRSLQDTLIAQKLLTVQAATESRTAQQQKIDEATRTFMALSDTDKKICARMLSANRQLLDSLNILLINIVPLASPGGKRRADCPATIEAGAQQCRLRQLAGALGLLYLSGNAINVGLRLLGAPGGQLAGAAFIAVGGASFLIEVAHCKSLVSSTGATMAVVADDNLDVSMPIASTTPFPNGVSVGTLIRIAVRNIQEGLDRNTPDVDIRAYVEAMSKLIDLFNGTLGDFLNQRIVWPAPQSGYLYPTLPEKVAVTVKNNASVTARISNFKQGVFDLTFTTTQNTAVQFDYTITYLFAGKVVSKTMTGASVLPQKSVIDLSNCTIKTPAGVPINKAGEAGTEYMFTLDGSCTFPPATLFSWTFGDGTVKVGTENKVYHTYQTAGTYPIKLRVLTQTGDDYLNFETVAQIGASPSNYYYSVQFGGQTFTFSNVYAYVLGGRFDIVGDGDNIQTGIFFSPASLLSRGPSLNRFVYHCTPTPEQPATYVLGAHLYSFSASKTIATTYSKGSVWGCDSTQPADNTTPGQLIITQNDGTVIEGTFEYTDFITKQPVQGRFRVPIR